MTTFTFKQLQEELKPWVLHNFGERPASQPLRGIVEELGELYMSLAKQDVEATQDGIADCLVFMADYCNSMGIAMSEVDSMARSVDEKEYDPSPTMFLKAIGKLCHHDLKKEQGIRKAENHDMGILIQLAVIVAGLRAIVSQYGWPSVEALTETTWLEVKKRDWKKNAVTGR